MRKLYLDFLIWTGVWVLVGCGGSALGFHDSSRVPETMAANLGIMPLPTIRRLQLPRHGGRLL